MTRLTILLAAAGTALLAMPATAHAQAAPIPVFGNDECPRSTSDEVLVCRRLPESERLRIPQDLRPGGALQERQPWMLKQEQLAESAATGTGSCSAVGPGGQTGCLAKEIRAARKRYEDDQEAQTAPLK